MRSLGPRKHNSRDTSDTEANSASDGEYEPVTEPEEDAPLDEDTSDESDNDIITTKVVEVSVGSDGDLVFADSERTDDTQSDSEVDYNDYWNCARCRAVNDSPIYRYCHKCFQVRKSFFPPRPRHKHKRFRTAELEPFKPSPVIDPETSSQEIPRALSQDSGVDTASQGTSQDIDNENTGQKRRAGFLDRSSKLAKYSDTGKLEEVHLSKSISDPSISIEKLNSITVIEDTLKQIETKELCIVCVTEPKSGVFVHGRLAHICCCYKCAVKVWMKTKKCPICKRKISNVLKAVVM